MSSTENKHKHPGDCPGGNCRLCWLAENDPRYQRLWGLPTSRPPGPGLGTKLLNFAAAAAGHAMSGFANVDDETYLERVKACEVCDFFRENTCTKCGCRVGAKKGIIDKARWKGQDCPVCSVCNKTRREGCVCEPFVSLWGPKP